MPEESAKKILEVLIKIAPIVFLSVGMKIAVQIKNKKATIIGSLISLFTGMGMAYLLNHYIENNTSEWLYPIALGGIAILSDKIMEFFVFKFDVGVYIEKGLEMILHKIKDNK